MQEPSAAVRIDTMGEYASTAKAGRLLAIGDIHGCRDQLGALLDQVRPTLDDQVVFLGDYVDRGPDSAGVIEDLIAFGTRFPQTIFLRGNHEQMLVDFLDGEDPAMFLLNGGMQTLDSYQARGESPVPDHHRAFLDRLRNYHVTEAHIFVHAGLRPGLRLEDQAVADLLWIRGDFIASAENWGKTVVYGHTPLEEPYLAEHRIGLDTGCVYGRYLTCCEVRTRRLWRA